MTFYGTASQPADSRSAQRGSLAVALLAGLGAAVAGAFVWGLVAYLTKHQFSLVAVLIGAAVGYAVSKFRPGDPAAAVASAVLALLGCALGVFLALIFTTLGAGIGLGTILGHLNVLMSAYPRSVGFLGVIFWLVAAYLGFRTALSGVRGRQARRFRGQPGGYPGAAGQPAPPAPGEPGSPRPYFGPPAGGPDGPGQPQPGQSQPDQAGTADGPGFALPKDPLPKDP